MADKPSGRAAFASSPLLTLAGFAVLYFVAGKLGLKLALVHASASAVWPATGVALAAFLLCGRRIWPAILAAAFLVNVTTAGSVLTSLGIAVGNTLEGLLGAWLLERYAGGLRVFERARNVFKFALLAGLLSTAVSATCGVTSLWLGGYLSRFERASVWLTWWLGDIGGSLVVAPVLLLWATRPWPRWDAGKAREAVLLLGTLLAVGLSVFGGLVPWARSLSVLSLPVLLWAALRFDQREAAMATALLSGIAAFGALRGVGPFADATRNTSLVLVQAFMATISVMTLAVAATVLQRRRAEEALARTAAIVDSSDDAIIAKTLDGTIVSWNRGAESLYGYSAAEVLGRNISILAPPDRPDEIPRMLAQVRRGEHVDHYETVRMRRDGRPVAISLSVSPIHDADGALVGSSAIARDITYRRRAEERLGGQFAVTRILTESPSLRDAAPRILQAIAEGFGWDSAELWTLAERGAAPNRLAAWPGSGAQVGALGAPLVSRVRGSGQHAWVEDVSADGILSRHAAAPGTRTALAWPVAIGPEVVAALVLFSETRRAPRQELLEQMADIAARIAQSLERERTLDGLRRLEKAVETIELGVTITDVNGRILYTNPAEAAMHGRHPEELIGKHVSTFMPEGWRRVHGRPREIRSWKRETVNVRRDGSVFPVQLLSDAVRDRDGTPLAVVTCSEEITERKRAEEALRSSEERYRHLFERNLAGAYRATLDGRLLECNDALAQILGHDSREELVGRSLGELSFDRRERSASVARLREEGGALTNVERRMRRKDGGVAWVLESQRLLAGDDGDGRVEATLVDITDRKEFQLRMEHQAFHDALTGLPNRAFLEQRLELLLSQAEQGLAVMFVDLDRFKAVNDSLGHAAGDAMLCEAAVRLHDSVRADDLVARVGGDEFVLLLPQVLAAGAARIASKILERMREPFALDGHQLQSSVSVGIALYPEDGKDAQELLASADGAMYRAKASGRDAFQFCGAQPAGQGS